jgi:hypothetical protein
MTAYKSILTSVFVIAISQNSLADIYKCKKPDGSTVFQDKRCPEKTAEQVFSKPRPKLCYRITSVAGRTFDVQSIWTEKPKEIALFSVQINQKKTAFSPEQIQSIKVVEQQDACVLAKLTNTARENFDATICGEIHYLTDKGEDYLVAKSLDSIKSCQSSIYADGFWNMDQQKSSIQSAYVSYSKQANQLKIVAFPFMLSKDEEDTMLTQHSVDSIINGKSGRYAVGIILKLKEGIATPQISDVIQFQSLVIDNKSTRVRSYDQNWRSALTLKKLNMSSLKQGGTAEISWSLKDVNQEADVNVSAIVVEEN